ncbi:MAG: helix-turn-helix domain-containing protein, partial [Pseudomonadota bacterium]
WPGNVRELQHVIEAAMNIVKNGTIGIKDLPVYLNDAMSCMDIVSEDLSGVCNDGSDLDAIRKMGEMMESMERKMIEEALKRSGGNVSKASKLLNMPRQTLQYKIVKYKVGLD